jgi:hypothetical protein
MDAKYYTLMNISNQDILKKKFVYNGDKTFPVEYFYHAMDQGNFHR